MNYDHEQTRLAAEADLETFIHLVHPQRVLGSIHSELVKWMTREGKKSHQLILLPRDHQKSTICGAYYTAWRITQNPAIRVLYISSTSNLAIKQLKFIKDILTSDLYRLFWPQMVNIDEAKREKWTETEISVDHPTRRAEIIRDPTVFTAGLTTSIVGLHCDLAIMDDVVTAQNGLTSDGREKTEQQYSLLASIEGANAEEIIVGTRYHPLDLYGTLSAKKIQRFTDKGILIDEEDLYETFERQVENIGDGSGEYLWPRQQNRRGQWFGFDRKILETKKAQYLDQTQFRAQYYNDPNSAGENAIPRNCFQYYDRTFINHNNDIWYFRNKRLNIFAAIDFAYSTKKERDHTAIVVVGIDSDNNYYVLDIDRFQTDQVEDYFKHLLQLHNKWKFNRVKAECTAAQQVIVNTLKTSYIRPYGLSLSIEEFKPSRYQGAKEERIAAVLRPRYENRQMWHYMGGNCQILEDELVLAYPPHDDLKDTLSVVVDSAIAPTNVGRYFTNYNDLTLHTHKRFGGIS
jgi:hypothetical protein